MDVSHFLSYLVYLTNPKEWESWHRMKTEIMYMTQTVSLAKEMWLVSTHFENKQDLVAFH